MRDQKYILYLYLIISQISIVFGFCNKYLDVRSADNSKEFETICIECPTDSSYIINDKYECYPQKRNSTNENFCNRVNQRLTCIEPKKICMALILSNQNIDYNFKIDNHRCAIISEDLKECVMPKFGHTLILPSSQFQIMNESFCAVLSSGKCIKYHHRFLPVKDKNYSVYLKDFFNFDKIIHEQSFSTIIVCDKDYKLETVNGIQGCLPKISDEQNCEQMDEYLSCKYCKDGYAINGFSGKCEQSSLDGCLIQINFFNLKYCQKCKFGYIDFNMKCIQLTNCAQFSQYPPFDCIACKYPFSGQYCDTEYPSFLDCEIQSVYENYSCLKCKDNETFYYNVSTKKCTNRNNSQNCKVKHPLGDYCAEQNQSDMVYYGNYTNFLEFILNPIHFTKDFFHKSGESVFKNQIEYFYTNGVKFYNEDIQLKKVTLVKDCAEYSYLADFCTKCNNDKYLMIYNNTIRNCSQETPKQQIVGCLLLDYGYGQEQCINCIEGYEFNSKTNLCEKMADPHCVYGYKDLNNVSKCIQCEKGYSFKNQSNNNFECIKVPNCKEFGDYENKGCTTCLQGPSFMITQILKDGKLQCESNREDCEQFVNGQCMQCFNGFTLIQSTKKCIQSEQLKFCKIATNENSCVECISKDYILNNNKCNPYLGSYIFNPACSEIQQEICVKCQEGYYLIKSICVKKCPDGKIMDPLKDCQNTSSCNSDCLECSKQNQCLKCQYNYLFYGQCISQCPSGYFNNFSTKECSKCSQNCLICYKLEECLLCDSPYQLNKGICLLSCEDGKLVKDLKECGQIQCPQTCKKCSSTNYCSECTNPTDILNNGQCFNCPTGQYLDKDQKCSTCSKQCLTCSQQDKCSSCAYLETSLEQNCICNQFLHNNKCVSQCPTGWNANLQSKVCERACKSGEYSVYQADKKVYQCQSVLDNQSEYCQQFIEQIPSIVQIKQKKITSPDENVNLFVIFNETPQSCYSYQLLGKPSFEIPLQQISNTLNQVQFEIKILKSDIMNPDKVEKNEKYSLLYLKIFYQNAIQYTFRIKLTFTYDLILSNDYQYTGEHQIIDPVCEDCDIPIEKQVQSQTSVKCPVNASCENGKIQVYRNSDLEITQQITEPKFQKNTLQPHSLKIKFNDKNGIEYFTQIKNYQFDNSQIGKITYKFKAIGGQNGQLIVTSKIFSAKPEFRILQQSPDQDEEMKSYWYGTTIFELKYKDLDEGEGEGEDNKSEKDTKFRQDNESGQDNKLGLLGIILICVSAGILIILISLYFVYKKKKSNRMTQKQQQNVKIEILDVEKPEEIISFDESQTYAQCVPPSLNFKEKL